MNIKELKEYIKDLPDEMEVGYMDFEGTEWYGMNFEAKIDNDKLIFQ